jgi:hypothetical protein
MFSETVVILSAKTVCPATASLDTHCVSAAVRVVPCAAVILALDLSVDGCSSLAVL